MQRILPLLLTFVLINLLGTSLEAQQDLEMVSASFEPGDDTVQPGDRPTIDYLVRNNSDFEVEDPIVGFYLSDDASFDGSDQFLESEDGSNLDPGESDPDNEQITIPSSTPPGCYFLIVIIDPNDFYDDPDRSNNAIALSLAVGGSDCDDDDDDSDDDGDDDGDDSDDGNDDDDDNGDDDDGNNGNPITDLAISQLVLDPDDQEVDQYGSISIDYQIDNLGDNTSPETVIHVSLSEVMLPSSGAIVISEMDRDSMLPGSTSLIESSITLPTDDVVPPGDYFLIVQIDPIQNTNDPDWSNNYQAVPITITGTDGDDDDDDNDQEIDLAVSELVLESGSEVVDQNGIVSFDYRIDNLGINESPETEIYVLLSDDALPSECDDILIMQQDWSPMMPESGSLVGMTFGLRFNGPVPPGQYSLIVVIDLFEDTNDTDRSNNFQAVPITVTGTDNGDYNDSDDCDDNALPTIFRGQMMSCHQVTTSVESTGSGEQLDLMIDGAIIASVMDDEPLGTITASVYIDDATDGENRQYEGSFDMMDRSLVITPEVQPSGEVLVMLYFTEEELMDFNLGRDEATFDVNNIEVRKLVTDDCAEIIDPSGLPAETLPNISINEYMDGFFVETSISSFSGFILVEPAATLPAEITSFTATALEKENALDWSIAIEEGVSHYAIQRTVDPVNGNWETIGRVAAGARTNHSYRFLDESPAYDTYYRLHILDSDGYEEFSPIRRVLRTDFLGNSQVSVFPNPATDRIFVRSERQLLQGVSLRVLNMNGRPVYTQQVDRLERGASLPIDLSQLPAGMYLLRLDGDQHHQVTRFLLDN